MAMILTLHGENKGTIAETVVNNYYTQVPQHPSAKHAQEAEMVEEVQEVKAAPIFFRTDAQSITKIEAKWQEALGMTTKTGVIRFVKSHDSATGYFKTGGLTNEQLAEEFNKAQNKFVFTENDFENANKPLRK